MFEKVNRHHPDKIADRIAGAIVDLAYSKSTNPKVACEVLIGHGHCTIINETSEPLSTSEVSQIVKRIAGDNIYTEYFESKQDAILAENQKSRIRCGDNGIFKGTRPTKEEQLLSYYSTRMDYFFDSDGKYIANWDEDEGIELIICQSKPSELGEKRLKEDLEIDVSDYPLSEIVERLSIAIITNWGLQYGIEGDLDVRLAINPLGDWTGGINVDTGATNRKLGSDMGRAVTGGGLHGKDLSKADVSMNIFAHLMAQHTMSTREYYCAIGDDYVNNIPYKDIVELARKYIKEIGGFEKFAETGLL